MLVFFSLIRRFAYTRESKRFDKTSLSSNARKHI